MPLSQRRRLETAELADLCLGHLAEDPGQLADFMGFAGYDPTSLRRAVGTQPFAHGLIDYFAGNEPLMLAFCANADIRPEEFMGVWHRINPEQ